MACWRPRFQTPGPRHQPIQPRLRLYRPAPWTASTSASWPRGRRATIAGSSNPGKNHAARVGRLFLSYLLFGTMEGKFTLLLALNMCDYRSATNGHVQRARNARLQSGLPPLRTSYGPPSGQILAAHSTYIGRNSRSSDWASSCAGPWCGELALP